MPLCEICSALRDASWAGPSDFLINHHRSYAELRDSARNGCSLCILIRMGLIHRRGTVDDRGVEDSAQSDRPLLQAQIQEVEELLLAKTEPFYLQRVYSVVNNTGGIHGFEYCQGTFDPNPPRVMLLGDIPPAFIVTTGPDLAASEFLRRLQGPRHDLHLAASWLRECQTEHPECRGQLDPKPPTRLLRISHGRDNVVLVASADSAQNRGPYIALSHCWGLITPLRTVMANYDDHVRGIKVSSLPKTFRDAVAVAQHLNVEYLWIDSLCIIQDSKEDWERECPRMSDIYSNAVLTIAAHDAANSSIGFLADYPHPMFSPVEVSIKANDGHQSAAVVEYSPKGFYNSSKWQSILSTRGWVLQERVLSPRILSFHQNRLIWECNQHVRSDDRHRPVQIEPGRAGAVEKRRIDTLPGGKLLVYWDHIVTVYSGCQLTCGEDRLPALSGIAQKISAKIQDRYLAGLWEADLHYGLAWYNSYHSRSAVKRCGAPLRPEPPSCTAPSWSWASTECAVSFYEAQYKWKELNIWSVSIEPRGQDPFGQTVGGAIRATGHLSRISIPPSKEDWRTHFYGPDDETQILGEFYPDCERAYKFTAKQRMKDRQKEVFALLLSIGGFNKRHKLESWTGLALEKEDVSESTEEETYRRIGLLRYSFLEHDPDGDMKFIKDAIAGSPHGSFSDQGSGSGPASDGETGGGSDGESFGKSDDESDGEIDGEIDGKTGNDWEIPPLPSLFYGCEKHNVILV